MPRVIRVFLFLVLLIVIILSGQSKVTAQNFGTLRGNVTDSLSGESLPFANILIEGTLWGSSADLKGNYIITGIPSEKNYRVKISYLGYKTKFEKIFIATDQITQLRVALSQEIIRLQTIEKFGDKYEKPNETDLGLQKISIKEIEN